ncbi:MAG: LacI family transcriptional regulator, partial [Lentisphaerae bacterium]
MKVNINDIAKEAGVSHQTVSRIMNGRAHLHRPATVKKVLQAAKKLGYRVNAAAQAIRLGKTNSLALLHDWQPGRSSLPYSLLEGIEGALEQHDLLLTLNRYTDEQMSNPAFVPKILREVRSDGLLINFHTSPPSAMEELLEAYRIPSI